MEAAQNSTTSTDAEYLLIAQAKDEYANGQYDDCLKTLDALDVLNVKNVKLNRAIVQFYKTYCKDHKKLLQEMKQIASDEPQSRNAMPIVLYNIAVIYYHRHMYYTAMEVLNPLLDKLESNNVTLAAPIGILMLNCLLITGQYKKARAFLDVLQLKLNVNSTDSVMCEEQATIPELGGSTELGRAFRLVSMSTQIFNRKNVIVPEEVAVEFSALKAHQYYINKDFQMAAKQLLKINNEFCDNSRTDDLESCVANNMGVIHLRVRHYAIAVKFFQNALIFDKVIAISLKTSSLQTMSQSHSCEFVYNLGIAFLHLKLVKEAFQCLLVPLKTFHGNPRIWMRLAEACIMEHEKNANIEEKASLGALLAASGKRRKVTLKPKPRVIYRKEPAALPEPTMEFAALCMRNALMLTNNYMKDFVDENNETNDCHLSWQQVRDNNFFTPSKPIASKSSLRKLRSAIYAAYSYISLCLGDYIKALEMAQELLKQEPLSDAHKMLGHMYIGEALIMLERPNDARPHMEFNLDVPLNAYDFETRDWQVKSVEAAQNVCRYNYAVALVLQGELDAALALLNVCNHAIVSTKVIALKMHIELKRAS